MSEVYRDIIINAGLGLYQTVFIGQVLCVKTENDSSRLVITFPATYVDYTKLMDVLYTGSEGTTILETYGLTQYTSVNTFYFILPRYMTYGETLYLQFRARYAGYTLPGEEPQEAVDAYILSINFRPALNVTATDVILEIPDSYTSVLQSMIDSIEASSVQAFTGTAIPFSTPSKIGNLYFNVSTNNLYFSTGTATSSDWKQVVM